LQKEMIDPQQNWERTEVVLRRNTSRELSWDRASLSQVCHRCVVEWLCVAPALPGRLLLCLLTAMLAISAWRSHDAPRASFT